MKALIVALICMLSIPANAQTKERATTKSVGSTTNTYTVVPAPSRYLDRVLLNATPQSTWQVDFSPNFPSSGQSAVNHAVEIWSYILSSPHLIKVYAEWKKLPVGALAQTGPESSVHGWTSCSSKNGITRSLSISAATRAFFRSYSLAKATFE